MTAKIIAVANHKGGTAKTTTVHHIGAYMAMGGYEVLLVDLDPQSSLTKRCGVKDAAGASMAEVLGGAQPGDLILDQIIQPVGQNLDLAPADMKLTVTEFGLVTRMARFALTDVLTPVIDRYYLILIDCAPSLSMLTINALAAADGVLCPTQLSMDDLRGLGLFISTLDNITAGMNPDLSLMGVVPVRCKMNTIHQRGILEALEKRFSVHQPIGETIRVSEASAAAETLFTYEPDNPQAAAYQKLGWQISKWLESNGKTSPVQSMN